MLLIRYLPNAVLAGLLLLVAGCGGQAPPPPEVLKEGPIREVGTLYRSYSADNKKPPEKAADLKRCQEMAPAGFQAIKDGSVEVLWGVKA